MITLNKNKQSPAEDVDLPFDEQPFWDRYERNLRFGVYWRNKAYDLHAAALLLGKACEHGGSFKISPQEIGLADGFCFSAALPSVFRLNAGLAIELFLKAIIVKRDGHNGNIKAIHRLRDLATGAGFQFNQHEGAWLDGLTEYIYWLGRYPVPKDRTTWDSALKDFATKQIRLPDYKLLWAALEDFDKSVPARRDGDW